MAAVKTTPREGFEDYVRRSADDTPAERARKAAYVESLIPELDRCPVAASLKGLSADDLRGWAAELRRGAGR